MALPRSLSAGAVAAGFALAYYVRRRHARTGDGYLQIVRSLPSDARRWAAETQRRATLALEDGKGAARERELELQRQLDAVASPAGAQ